MSREKKELKRQKEMIVQSKRMYSQVQINMLEKLAKKQYNIEKENDGLLIVKAVYGDKRYVSYNNETNSSAIVDVTLPCRYLVRVCDSIVTRCIYLEWYAKTLFWYQDGLLGILQSLCWRERRIGSV